MVKDTYAGELITRKMTRKGKLYPFSNASA